MPCSGLPHRCTGSKKETWPPGPVSRRPVTVPRTRFPSPSRRGTARPGKEVGIGPLVGRPDLFNDRFFDWMSDRAIITQAGLSPNPEGPVRSMRYTDRDPVYGIHVSHVCGNVALLRGKEALPVRPPGVYCHLEGSRYTRIS